MLPASFLEHLRAEGYHPRSDKHSRALCDAIVVALVERSPLLADLAARKAIVYRHNHDVAYGHATWNTDLAIGPPADVAVVGDVGPLGMAIGTPVATRLAVEAKSVMTEHRKAIKNRKRDLEAHHAHVHDYDATAIAGGIVVINSSPTFRSPLRPELTEHRNVGSLVEHCIGEINSITMAGGGHPVGLDAKCAVVVSMDNVTFATTQYDASVPVVGSPIYWDAFIDRMAQLYQQRFG